MKKIKKELPKATLIEINGEVFTVQVTDIDIMEKAVELQKKFSNLAETDIEGITKGIRTIISYIDEILGAGSTKKITKDLCKNKMQLFSWINYVIPFTVRWNF